MSAPTEKDLAPWREASWAYRGLASVLGMRLRQAVERDAERRARGRRAWAVASVLLVVGVALALHQRAGTPWGASLVQSGIALGLPAFLGVWLFFGRLRPQSANAFTPMHWAWRLLPLLEDAHPRSPLVLAVEGQDPNRLPWWQEATSPNSKKLKRHVRYRLWAGGLALANGALLKAECWRSVKLKAGAVVRESRQMRLVLDWPADLPPLAWQGPWPGDWQLEAKARPEGGLRLWGRVDGFRDLLPEASLRVLLAWLGTRVA